MFRAQPNPMDDAIVKATDENLTSENWEFILDVCDRVSANSSGPQQAVAALIKRLSHRNANVQLYTLELANALSQNCGPALHRELASKAFTDALLRLAGERNTHAQVKQKVLERMGTWTEEFGRQPELGIMEQAYGRLRQQQPGLMPPSKPVKQQISADERAKEEEELQMALALSVKDKGAVASPEPGAQTNGGATSREDSGAQEPVQTQAQGTTAATVSRVRALYDFSPSEPGELAFRKGDVIAVLESVYKDWWKGSLRGNTGIFPLNYVEKLQDPTKEELERDAQMENEVFGEIKSVEKLLALLSVRGEGGAGRRGEREEEEISELYQRTLGIRPKLIELIGKYSQKKDDFTQLNEKFIKARRDYEALLESSMTQPQYQQQYPVRARPSQQNIYPPQHPHQPPYGQQGPPPQNYPPQGPPSAQGYPPPQRFAQQSQQQLPPQQDPQRFYSPAPSEPPGPAQQPPQQQQQSYNSPYPQQQPQGGPPAPSSANGGGGGGGPAPFHFIPGGVQQGPPPPNQQPQQQPPPSSQQHQQEIRRKPSPQSLDGYQHQHPQAFQDPALRPNSIHTLNSGNPQELGTGGYESPVDNRRSYPPALGQQGFGQQGYDTYAPPPVQQQQPQGYGAYPGGMQGQSDRDGLPSRQRTHSFESSTGGQGVLGSPQLGQPPLQQQQQQYQAYQPQASSVAGGVGDADPGGFYR